MAETGGAQQEGMAEIGGAPQEDLIAELADIGEKTVRRIVGFPRRVVSDVRERVGKGLGDVAAKLRSIDPLDRRVAELEKRLDALQMSEKPASAGAQPSRARAASASAQVKSRQAADDPGAPGDETAA